MTLGGAVTEAAAAKKKTPRPSFFNSLEIRSKNLTPFKKWRGALKKYSAERKVSKKAGCSDRRLDICSYDDWIKFLATLKDADRMTQLRRINERMNRATYIQDPQNWGKKDYWASPAEFMARFGDCEDYAIIKYLSLRMLGWRDRDLRVVAVKDLNLKVGHAVLVVYVKNRKTGRKTPFVLDNQIKQVVEASRIRHYLPVFSINKTFWWRHLA